MSQTDKKRYPYKNGHRSLIRIVILKEYLMKESDFIK